MQKCLQFVLTKFKKKKTNPCHGYSTHTAQLYRKHNSFKTEKNRQITPLTVYQTRKILRVKLNFKSCSLLNFDMTQSNKLMYLTYLLKKGYKISYKETLLKK